MISASKKLYLVFKILGPKVKKILRIYPKNYVYLAPGTYHLAEKVSISFTNKIASNCS